MLNPTLRLLLALACTATALTAQLSGDYTIDPNSTGTRNYQSFAAATAALQTGGVKGAVRLRVGVATHRESWKLGPVSGASATNTITFRAQTGGTKLTAAKLPIIDLSRAAHVVLDGFDLAAAPTQTNGSLIQVGGSDYLEVTNCRLITSRAVWGISGQGNGWAIHDNAFVGNGLSGGGGRPPCRVYRNGFVCVRGQDYPAIAASGTVYNNVIIGTTSSSSSAAGAYIPTWNCDFWHNTISVNSPRAGIRVQFFGSSSSQLSTVFNNIIDVRGAGVGVDAYTYSSTAILNTEFDNNLYSVASGNIGSVRGKIFNSMSSWQGAISNQGKKSHYDRNSSIGDPKFVGAADFHLRKDSAAVDRAMLKPVSHFGSSPVPVDRDGLYRGNMRDIGAYELAGYRYFGAGCAGTGGNTPFLDIQGDVGPGKFARFYLTKARPAVVPLFLVGMQQTKFKLGGSCQLLTMPLVMLRTTTTSPTGASYIQFNLPRNQAVSGLTAFTQFAIADRGAGGLGFAVTRGGSIHL